VSAESVRSARPPPSNPHCRSAFRTRYECVAAEPRKIVCVKTTTRGHVDPGTAYSHVVATKSADGVGSRMSKSTLSKLGAAALVVGLLVVAWFVVAEMGRERARAAASVQVPPVPVTTTRAQTKDVPVLVRGIGTVQAFKTVAVKTRVDGQIVKVAF